jgi:hypothetical protein
MTLSGYVGGGVSIGALVASIGAGVEGRVSANAQATASRSLTMSLDTNRNFTADYALLSLAMGAQITADLSIYANARSWLGQRRWRWPFANFNIGRTSGGTFEVAMGNGGSPFFRVGGVRPGAFTWGNTPQPNQNNGRQG